MLEEEAKALNEFILSVIDSLGQLEVLLLLRAHPDRTWNAKEVSDELRTNPAAATGHLESLFHHGLLFYSDQPAPLYRYQPQSGAMTKAVDVVAQAYRDDRLRVISLIYSKPIDRLRIFADAFKIRKEDTPS
mgnify:CR=1 FL=1